MDTGDGENEGLVIALLDFPKGGTFGLDGQNIVLETGDFLGVKDVRRNGFHLVTCKTGHGASRNGEIVRNTIDTAVTVGFLVFGDDGDGNHLVRKYDPQTEEAASEQRSPVDAITKRNLVQQMTDGSLPPSRVLRYDQIVSDSGGKGCNANQEEQLSQRRIWKEQTRYIHIEPSSGSKPCLLKDLRGLTSGDKIVPGCYDPEDETNKNGDPKATAEIASKEIDGRSLAYPPIPVVDPKLSLAKHKHHGTSRFLSRLEPHERTRLFLSSCATAAATRDEASANHPNFVWLDRVLKDCYQNSWEALLGDLQLSYILFLYLGCFSSLEHWKDLLAMLSLAVDGVEGGDNQQRSSHNPHESLYRGLLRLLPYQLSSMNDPEFLEDIDEGGGNFLVPSLVRLKRYYETRRQPESAALVRDEEDDDEDLLSKFRHVLSAMFPQTFYRPSVPSITRIRSNSDGDGDTNDTADRAMDTDATNEDSWNFEDDDGPVVVSSEEIEASMARSSASFGGSNVAGAEAATNQQLRREYPLLAAAMMPSEDVLMTCARALDEKTDVSLVREAAAYLEQVEHRRGFF